MGKIEKIKIDFKYKPKYSDKQGDKLVGVTTAINQLAKPALIRWAYNLGVSGVDMNEYMNFTKRIGTITHTRIMASENNLEIDRSNITKDEWQASDKGFKSYLNWYKNTKIKPYFYEKSFVSLKYRYGGKPDKFGDWNGVATLIDYKSGKNIYPDNFIQLSAYVKLLIENNFKPLPERVLALNIPRFDGDSFAVKDMSVRELLENGYWEKFLAGLKAYNASIKIDNSTKDVAKFKDNDDFYNFVKKESKK